MKISLHGKGQADFLPNTKYLEFLSLDPSKQNNCVSLGSFFLLFLWKFEIQQKKRDTLPEMITLNNKLFLPLGVFLVLLLPQKEQCIGS